MKKAETVCVPGATAVVVNRPTAAPLPAAATGAKPTGVPSTRNVTVPAGGPPLPVTVARKVTGWPSSAGLGETVSAVAVATGLSVKLAPVGDGWAGVSVTGSGFWAALSGAGTTSRTL